LRNYCTVSLQPSVYCLEEKIILCNLVASFTCLESLELEGCWFLTGKGLLKIAQNNPQLHSLNLLNNLYGRDQSAILEILEKDLIRLTDLKLDIYDIEDEKMAVLDRVASSLQHLTIRREGDTRGLGPQALGAICRLPSLRSLVMQRVEQVVSTQNPQRANQLITLRVEDSHLRDEDLRILAAHTPQIVELKMDRCTLITDAGLSDCFQHWKKLRVLHVIRAGRR
jgi:hypothetical protein